SLQSRRDGSIKPGAQAPGKAFSRILMSPEGAAADRRIPSCCRPLRALEMLDDSVFLGLTPQALCCRPLGTKTLLAKLVPDRLPSPDKEIPFAGLHREPVGR